MGEVFCLATVSEVALMAQGRHTKDLSPAKLVVRCKMLKISTVSCQVTRFKLNLLALKVGRMEARNQGENFRPPGRMCWT